MEEVKVIKNKKWQRAELELVKFDTADIITTSDETIEISYKDSDNEFKYETPKVVY